MSEKEYEERLNAIDEEQLDQIEYQDLARAMQSMSKADALQTIIDSYPIDELSDQLRELVEEYRN